MGAISKSEPIFSKLSTHHSRLNSVRYTKFRANRRINRDLGAPFTLNRTKQYMGAICKSEPIFTRNLTHIFLDLVQYAMRNFVQIEGYIGTLLHHLHKIGRKYIWELYLNLDRFSRNLVDITLGSIQYVLPSFIEIKKYKGTLVNL